jgi:spore germination protein KC
VFGESFAKKGMNQFLDPLIRFPDARFSHVVTTYGITAKELLQSPYLLESIPAIGIRNILLSRSAIDIKIDEFLDGVAARDRSPITAAVSLNAKDKENPTYLINRAAVYRGNKLVGFLSPEETNLFRMWSKDVNALSLYTQLERENRDFKGLVTIGALDVKTKVQTKIKNQIPEATIVYTIHARIIENETELDMSKPEHLHRLEAKIARETEEKLNKMMTRLQKEFKSDIYGLGKEVHIQNPYYWKKVQDSWFAIYPEVPVTTKVEIKIEQMGRTRAPVHTKK